MQWSNGSSCSLGDTTKSLRQQSLPKTTAWHLAFHPHTCSSKLMQTRNSHEFSVVLVHAQPELCSRIFQFWHLAISGYPKKKSLQLHDGTWGSSTTQSSKVFPMLVSGSLTAGARVAARDFSFGIATVQQLPSREFVLCNGSCLFKLQFVKDHST